MILVGINPGVCRRQPGITSPGRPTGSGACSTKRASSREPITHEDDVRLPEWGIGMTNLVARPSPGIDDLSPAEYLEGWKILEKKIERFRPEIVAFVGVTMYRALWRVLAAHAEARGPVIKPGFQKATVHGARLFVLPNPSGRNAHFSYDDMLRAFRALGRAMRACPLPPPKPKGEGGCHDPRSGARKPSW